MAFDAERANHHQLSSSTLSWGDRFSFQLWLGCFVLMAVLGLLNLASALIGH